MYNYLSFHPLRSNRRHVAIEAIVSKCLGALGNLSFNSASNSTVIANEGGVPATAAAMREHEASCVVNEMACTLLSNVMLGNVDHKLLVGEVCLGFSLFKHMGSVWICLQTN